MVLRRPGAWTPWGDCSRDEGGGPVVFVTFLVLGLALAGLALARMTWWKRGAAMTAAWLAAVTVVFY